MWEHRWKQRHLWNDGNCFPKKCFLDQPFHGDNMGKNKDVMGDIEPTTQDYQLGLPKSKGFHPKSMDLYLGNAVHGFPLMLSHPLDRTVHPAIREPHIINFT